ncbi:MAG TPA: PP2C family serine/threonine-protein phosphatase, partial [Myxococcota bacterium]|nr:PP2C family serine/threonine-protein phosphatase [Myxococcota bacterium]
HRDAMEDTACVQWLGGDRGVVGLFDGHGGDSVARAAAELTPLFVDMHLRRLPGGAGPALVRAALMNVFDREDVLSISASPAESCLQEALIDLDWREAMVVGCTAVVALFDGPRLYIANLGDSRAILVRPDGSAQRLSCDQKPDDPWEAADIAARGGTVSPAGRHDVSRVDGYALSRALGDELAHVGHRPQVTHLRLDAARGGVLLLVTDGVTDVLHDDPIGEHVANLRATGALASHAAGNIVRAAFNRGSYDNISAAVVYL